MCGCSQQDWGGAELRQKYEEEEERSFEEQSVLALEDRKSALLRAMTGECWRDKFLHVPGGCSHGAVLSGADSGAASADDALRRRLQALDQNFTFQQSAMAVQLSTARAGLSYCPEARAFLRACGPTGAEPRCDARYQVFRDLRGRGFYLTSAGKFGGDFLVYPGE